MGYTRLRNELPSDFLRGLEDDLPDVGLLEEIAMQLGWIVSRLVTINELRTVFVELNRDLDATILRLRETNESQRPSVVQNLEAAAQNFLRAARQIEEHIGSQHNNYRVTFAERMRLRWADPVWRAKVCQALKEAAARKRIAKAA
jgi:hypothetical protein